MQKSAMLPRPRRMCSKILVVSCTSYEVPLNTNATARVAFETEIDVRFGSKADICSATRHVRFTPNSDRKSRHAQMVMSALPLKADMCGATRDVRYGPIADISPSIRLS